MSLYQSQLKEILAYYQSLADMYRYDLKNSPLGTLVCQTHHGKNQFLQIYREDSRRIRRVITKDIELQRALAKKEFSEKALKILDQNIQNLKQAIDGITPFDPDLILKNMTKGYAKLPEEFFFDRNSLTIDLHLDGEENARVMRHREWGQEPCHESSYYEEHKNIMTSKGIKVRSKSEALILEMNYRFDLDVKYDEELWLGSHLIVPDFTYQGADGRPFFWEHMGMMNKPDYAAHNYEKLQDYYECGILLGDRLILTFDKDGTIDMGMIEATITHEVIPRL